MTKALIEDATDEAHQELRRTEVNGAGNNDPSDRVSVTWLGQAGFLLAGANERILIDPFYSAHELRLHEPSEIEQLPADLGWLLVTHEHRDHFDVPTLEKIVQHSPGASLVVPTPMLEVVKRRFQGVSVRGVQPGDRTVAGAVTITSVPAIHGLAIEDGYSDGRSSAGGLSPFSGYLLEFPSLSVYHGGDTIVDGDLIQFLQARKPDVALLPVNGRDFFREERGWVGNLNVRGSLRFGSELGSSFQCTMTWFAEIQSGQGQLPISSPT